MRRRQGLRRADESRDFRRQGDGLKARVEQRELVVDALPEDLGPAFLRRVEALTGEGAGVRMVELNPPSGAAEVLRCHVRLEVARGKFLTKVAIPTCVLST